METLEAEERYVKLDFTLDDGISHRAAIGLVVLATDHTIEYEWRKLLAIQGVGFYECGGNHTRDAQGNGYAHCARR
jgi:maleate isomerase